MFLFRKNAETVEEAEDHEPINVTNTARTDEGHEEGEVETINDSAQAVGAGSEERHRDEDAQQQGDEQDHEEESKAAADVRVGSEDTPYASREGTVPPLEEQHIMQQQREVEAEEEAQASAAPPALAATAVMSSLNIPHTSSNQHSSKGANGTGQPPNNTNGVHRGSRGTTPRATTAGQSPRPHSHDGRSYTGSVRTAGDTGAEDQQNLARRCSSTVLSARNLSERRASAVNQCIGSIDGGFGAARRRTGSMSPAEREAVERMLENEQHRQEAAEREAQFSLIRETTLVEAELAKEKTSYEHLIQRERERQAEIGRRSSLREERMLTAAQRRQELEDQRQLAILDAITSKDERSTAGGPYAVAVARRRYHSPATPARRQSAAVHNGNGSNGGGGGTSDIDQRRQSAPAEDVPPAKRKTDTSRPRQCLPMSAWRTPEQQRQQQKKNEARAGSKKSRCLPPGAWQAPTVADHPRQWH